MDATRRGFLAATALSSQKIPGANDRIALGLIGCGGRGLYVGGFIKQQPNVEFVAVADVYQRNAEKARVWAGAQAQAYPDFRRILERKDVDAVLIATPDHWHAIPATLACQAGKDIYIEKPLAHNVTEGRAIVEAARRSGRIVQAGTQQRSAAHLREVQEMVQGGSIGTVHFVRVWNFVNMVPAGIGNPPDSAPPAGLDWDFWLGPAPFVPFNPARFLSTYRWFRDYSGGFITDYGTHRFDTVHQIMGEPAPISVSATGGRFAVGGAGDTPDILQVTYQYPGFVMSYEGIRTNGQGLPHSPALARHYNQRGAEDRPHGMVFYGTKGTIFADRIGWELIPENGIAGSGLSRRQRDATDATSLHAAAFIECLRTRREPAATVETGHRATTVALIGNIAFDTGRKLKWNASNEEFPGDAEANRLLARAARPPWTLA